MKRTLVLLLLAACSDDFTADPKPDRGNVFEDGATWGWDSGAEEASPDAAHDAVADTPTALDAPKDTPSMCWQNGDLCNVYLGDAGPYTKCCSGTTPDKCVTDQNNVKRCVP